MTLDAGFTTVRDLGTYRAFADAAMRDAIAKGDFPGPRMFVAGAYLTITGGGGAMSGGLAPDIELPWDLSSASRTAWTRCGSASGTSPSTGST